MKHTIEQLREMPDTELAELTARLRGWTTDGLFLRDSGDPLMHKLHWTPAADIAQAYGLLVWAKNTHGLKFEITVANFERIAVFPPRKSNFTILGIDARAMVYAFVLAMEEVSK